MQAIEVPGVWWLPDAPERKLFGTLTLSEEGELKLSTMGVFGVTSSSASDYPVIFGEAAGDLKGEPVTLRDCHVAKHSFGSYQTALQSEVVAQRGFIGAHLADGSVEVHSADISFSGLPIWASNLTGFTRNNYATEIKWTQPPMVGGEVLAGSFLIGVGISVSDSQRERQMKENVGVSFTFRTPLAEPVLQTKIVYPLQNFFSFATDRPNALTRLKISRGLLPLEQISIHGPRTFADESAVEDTYPFQMLFTLEDVMDRVGKLLEKWLTLSDDYFDAFALYFGSMYRPPGYVDMKFALMMQVVTLYQAARRQSTPVSGRIESMVRAARDVLKGHIDNSFLLLLDHHPLVGAERALVALIRENTAEFAPLVMHNGQSDIKVFIDYVLNTLSYTMTRRPPDGAYTSDGSALYWLTERIAFLFKIAILRELGFSDSQRRSILDRNPRYQHIRDTVTLDDEWNATKTGYG